MRRRIRLVAILGATALAVSACLGDAVPEPSPSTGSETEIERPVVAPTIRTTGFVEGSNSAAWIFNEYGNGLAGEFGVARTEELCAMRGDYAVTVDRHDDEVRGWYLPTGELAWQRSNMRCPTDGLVPQRISDGAVLGNVDTSQYAGELVEFATSETIIAIPTLDPESRGAPMPIVVSGGVLVLNLGGSLYGVNEAGKIMWSLSTPGWKWSKNLMTGHVFGLADNGGKAMVVNGYNGKIVLETEVPIGRPLTLTNDGFMYKAEGDDQYTFVTLDGTVTSLDPSFQGTSHVPTPLSGGVFPLNLYLNPKAGPVFDADGFPADFDIDMDSLQREGLSAEPLLMAVTADGHHALVDDRGGTVYLVNQAGDIVWSLDAVRPWVLGSYLVAETGAGNVQILLPNFNSSEPSSADR